MQVGQVVIDEITRSDRAGHSRTLAYVVMLDHLHWLFELERHESLSRVVGCVKGRAARRINADRQNPTRLWQSGFHDHAVRREENLGQIVNYLLANPVRAGLVADYREYRLLYGAWSEDRG